MSKKEEFRSFIAKHPELLNYVRNKEYNWQDFYEIYDIYGENNEVWSKYYQSDREEERASGPINELTNLVKGINLENVQKYINNAQKAIGVIQELTTKNPINKNPLPSKTPRPITKFFGD